MLHQDLQSLLDRLERISRALDLGCECVRRRGTPTGSDRDLVAHALVETCWEGLRLGHELVRRLAYDDLWSDLELLLHCWQTLAAHAHEVRDVAGAHPPADTPGPLGVVSAAPHGAPALGAGDALEVTREVVQSLTAITTAVAAIDAAQVQATARPRDAAAVSQARAAIAQLEAAADRHFMDSLAADVHGRLDAAMALLTTIAARASRERAACGIRRS